MKTYFHMIVANRSLSPQVFQILFDAQENHNKLVIISNNTFRNNSAIFLIETEGELDTRMFDVRSDIGDDVSDYIEIVSSIVP